MKYCNTCKTEKENNEFGKRKVSFDGLSAKCKKCQSAYDKSRANNPKRVKAREDYAKTEAGIESGNRAKKKWANENKGKKYQITKSYRENNPNKSKAHGKGGYEIKKGGRIKETCECGGVDVHAHHDDYAKPLKVRWLCAKHHSEWHNENGEGLNP